MRNLNNAFLLISVIYSMSAIGLIALNFLFRKLNFILQAREKFKILRINIPAENEISPVSAEQIFATLHSILKNKRISFEIKNAGGEIKFFVAVPENLANFAENQIYAQYPGAEIIEGENSWDADEKSAVSIDLKLNFTDIFPIKRYPQFEDRVKRVYIDSMAAVTSSLAKLHNHADISCIQIVIKPLNDKYRIKYLKCLRIYSRSSIMNIESIAKIFINAFCTRKWIYKIIFFPAYIIFWAIGISAEIKSEDKNREIEEKTSRIHERESKADAAIDKISKPLFEVCLRVLCAGCDARSAFAKAKEIASSFSQFNLPYLNSFVVKKILDARFFINRIISDSFVLNTEELATIWHLPNMSVQTPGISFAKSRKLEPPNNIYTDSALIIGKTDFRNVHKEFGISASDRRRHIYIVGKTGMGKTTLLANMIVSDINKNNGFALVDPHGDLADRILDFIPAARINDVILIDPSDINYPIGFNIFESRNNSFNPIIASSITGIFKKIYSESWGPRLEYILRNTILSVLEIPNSTLMWIIRMFRDDYFRAQIVSQLKDPVVKNFWICEFEKLSQSKKSEAVSPILNKVGQFLSNPIMRNILCQPKTKIDFRFAMDNKKIVIINLSKGRIGEDNSSLLGSMIITKFYLDAMSRADIKESERQDFHLYIDEFQNFATDSFIDILSEARKYKLNLVLANQYVSQMSEKVSDAVFGNVGTMIAFQLGADDSEYISSQFGEIVETDDLIFLSKYSAYIKLLIDGVPSKPFSMKGLAPPEIVYLNREKIIKVCREKFSRGREFVEEKIKEFS